MLVTVALAGVGWALVKYLDSVNKRFDATDAAVNKRFDAVDAVLQELKSALKR